MSECIHIASFIVCAKPERLPSVADALCAMQGVEVTHSDPNGKMIVVIETDSDAGVARFTEYAHQTAGVIAVSFVFHQSDSDANLAKELT